MLLVGLLGIWLLLPKPSLEIQKDESTAFYDRSGKLLRVTLASDERYRLFSSLDKVPENIQRATLLYEDQFYYQHVGVNFVALWRAFWQTYVIKTRRVGASTITMQVARLQYGLDSKSLIGKLKQIVYALLLERHYSKNDILEAYFNLAPYGGNVEGIEAASEIYFRKTAVDLTLPEALLLAVVPQNPSKRNPQSERGLKQSLAARQRLFERWLEYYPEVRNMSHVLDMPLAILKTTELPFHSPHFVTRLQLDTPFLKGKVTTSLNLEYQQLAESWLKTHVNNRRHEGIQNGSVLLVNHETMSVEAWVGSANFYDNELSGQVDGIVAKRSPGSALKPFVYSLGLDQGLIHPKTLMKDSPSRYGAYTPENFDKKFLGPILATDALITSRNVPAVNLQAKLSEPNFYEFLERASVSELEDEDHYGLSLSLGGMEVSMLEMAHLYGMLANGGKFKPVKKILSDDSTVEGGASQPSEKNQLVSAEAAYITLDMLSHNPKPDDILLPSIIKNGTKYSWKTGTSFAFRDAWAVGVSGPYVLVVWVGNFDGEGNPSFIGRTAAGPLFFSLFQDLAAKGEWVAPQMPQGLNIKKVDVCASTGDLPGQFCPQTTESWFIPGVSPITVSKIHRAVAIDKQTGKRRCWHDPKYSIEQIYEFWPSDMDAIFRKAGINIKRPPKLLSSCTLENAAALAEAPKIQSPVHNVIYSLRSHKIAEEKIAFKATVDASVDEVHWFVDDTYVGSNARNDLTLWSPKVGRFQVKVVDDLGLTDDLEITIKLAVTE